jgi:deoxyadenosine/deoxycytidine kinase
MVKLITIEGCIGSGKSTLISILISILKVKDNILIIPEPIERWEGIKDSKGKNILEAFYDNPKENGYSFQMIALLTRRQILIKMTNKARILEAKIGKEVFLLTERTIYSDYNIFAKMLHKDEILNEHEMIAYKLWFDEYHSEFKLDKAIYIKASPEICYQRKNVRNRNGEENISLKYLKNCSDAHEAYYTNFLSKMNCKVIDNECDMNTETYEKQINDIIEYIFDVPL